jgi:hypothetical protein
VPAQLYFGLLTAERLTYIVLDLAHPSCDFLYCNIGVTASGSFKFCKQSLFGYSIASLRILLSTSEMKSSSSAGASVWISQRLSKGILCQMSSSVYACLAISLNAFRSSFSVEGLNRRQSSISLAVSE